MMVDPIQSAPGDMASMSPTVNSVASEGFGDVMGRTLVDEPTPSGPTAGSRQISGKNDKTKRSDSKDEAPDGLAVSQLLIIAATNAVADPITPAQAPREASTNPNRDGDCKVSVHRSLDWLSDSKSSSAVALTASIVPQTPPEPEEQTSGPEPPVVVETRRALETRHLEVFPAVVPTAQPSETEFAAPSLSKPAPQPKAYDTDVFKRLLAFDTGATRESADSIESKSIKAPKDHDVISTGKAQLPDAGSTEVGSVESSSARGESSSEIVEVPAQSLLVGPKSVAESAKELAKDLPGTRREVSTTTTNAIVQRLAQDEDRLRLNEPNTAASPRPGPSMHVAAPTSAPWSSVPVDINGQQPGSEPQLSEARERTVKPQVLDAPLMEAPAPGSIHLLSRVERQEMHFGWNTPEFGRIEVRTTIEHDRVGAVVAVPDPSLRDSLESNLGGLSRALADQSLELGQFQASDSSTSSGSQRNHDHHSGNGNAAGWHPHEPAAEFHVLPRLELTHTGLLDLRA